MPLFGNRMVCETANYKHIQERKQDMFERETKLAQWYKDKAERKQRLRDAKERLRQGSVCSTASTTSSIASTMDEVAVTSCNDQGHGRRLSSVPTTPTIMVEDTKHIVGEGRKINPACCGECILQ